MTADLDRAIAVADHKVKELYDQKQKRRYARALIRDLFTNLQPPDDATCYERDMWRDTLNEILRRAGIIKDTP